MKVDQASFSFDFDQWKTLAETDPEAFERRRQAVIESYIGGVRPSKRQRLRGLQWRVDMERRRSSNPMQSFLRIYTMMWDSVCGERGLLQVCTPSAARGQQKRGRPSAQVVSIDGN
jgi:hypothetical protein